MKIPTNVRELRSFLGLVRFYDKFIPSISDVAKPLHDLLKNDVVWRWEEDQHQAFAKIKEVLTTAPGLNHFNPDMPIVLATDASPFGISAVLSHRDTHGNELPVAYASRSLSSSEARYAQIDREALAIIFGVKKFSQFLLGRHFTLITDHKPLQSIFSYKKGLPEITTARLHRYAIILLMYNFTVEYRPGDLNGNADALSRAPADFPVEGDDETDNFLNYCVENSKLSPETLESEMLNDILLSQVIIHVRNGWPERQVANLGAYWTHRNELSEKNNIIYWGDRVVIPHSMRNQVLEELHKSHIGMVKMKSNARQYVWWPKIGDDIEEFVKSCQKCQIYSSLPPRQPVQPWPQVNPWQRIHLDFCQFSGKQYLILFDAGSKWLEAKEMNSTTSIATLKVLYSWFCTHGFPEHIHTDGGPQFVSGEFKNKMREWNVSFTISPPYNPTSNGAAERAVRTVKDGLRKGVPLNQLLFTYRSTPLFHGQPSPAELLFGRRIRTRLSGLSPKKPSNQTLETKFKPGDCVWIRDFRPRTPKWEKAIVLDQTGRAIVNVQTEEGTVLRRHVNHTRHV